MIDNNNEVETKERSKTLGGLDVLKLQDAEQKYECQNTSDTVDKKITKKTQDAACDQKQ